MTGILKQFISQIFNREPNLLVSRSPEWKNVRDQFVIDNGSMCACCSKTENLNVHHIIPVHINPELELDKSNLIVLCQNKNLNCHLSIGHLGSFLAYNPTVVEDVTIWKNKIKERKYK